MRCALVAHRYARGDMALSRLGNVVPFEEFHLASHRLPACRQTEVMCLQFRAGVAAKTSILTRQA